MTEEEKAAFKPVPSLLKKGEASIHHPLMVHGSFPNKYSTVQQSCMSTLYCEGYFVDRTDKPRRAAVVNYFADGVRSDSDDPLLPGAPIVKKVGFCISLLGKSLNQETSVGRENGWAVLSYCVQSSLLSNRV